MNRALRFITALVYYRDVHYARRLVSKAGSNLRRVCGALGADYIRVVDVPESKLAFKLRGQQVRYLSIAPKRTEKIERIEFVKGDVYPVRPRAIVVRFEIHLFETGMCYRVLPQEEEQFREDHSTIDWFCNLPLSSRSIEQ